MNYLKEDIDDDNQERVGQVEEEPDLYRFDVRRAGQTIRNWEVDGGQNHEGGDVQIHYDLVSVLSLDVVGGLVDDVHQDGGQVGDGEDGGKVSAQLHFNDNSAVPSRSESHLVYFVLTHLLNASILNAKMMMW